MKPVLAGIGELLWDLLPGGRRPGGAPANTACHFQELGGRGVIVSSIGSDDSGRELIEQLRSHSPNCEYISIDKHHATGVSSVKVDSQGVPVFDIRENVAWDFIPLTPDLDELAGRTEVVVFGTLAQRSAVSLGTIRSFVSKVHASAWCILDVNLRYPYYSRNIIESSLSLAHILKLNEDELHILAGMLSLEGDENRLLAQLLRRYKLDMIALTKGAAGSVLYSENKRSVHPGYRTEVVDTVGAGDAFTAVLAMGILKGKDLDHINENANRLAAYVCSRPGATPVLSKDIRTLVKKR